MPRYSLLCLATTWLPNVDVASHVYYGCVYSLCSSDDDDDDDCIVIFFLLLARTRLFRSRLHSLPIEHRACILSANSFSFCATNKMVRKYLCVCVCLCMYAIGLTDTPSTKCVLDTQHTGSFHILRTCIRCIYRIFVYTTGDSHTQPHKRKRTHCVVYTTTRRYASSRTHCNIVSMCQCICVVDILDFRSGSHHPTKYT